MLQNIGDILKGQRWLAFLVLGLLILVFALWGTYGVVDLTFGAPKYGLKVNGEEIPAATLQQAWQERQSQYQQQTRADIPPAMRTQLQNQLLDQYTRETLMRQRATSEKRILMAICAISSAVDPEANADATILAPPIVM